MKNNKKEDLRVIPKNNYAKLSTIFVITIIVVVFAFVSYRSHSSFINNIPVIRGTLSEIEEKDLNNYITEHDEVLLYVGVASDENCRSLEEDLKETLKNRGLLNTIYLNITSISNKEDFYKSFNNNYSDNIKLNNYPAFVIISNNKIVDLVERKDNKLNIGDVERLLDEYGIKGEVK